MKKVAAELLIEPLAADTSTALAAATRGVATSRQPKSLARLWRAIPTRRE